MQGKTGLERSPASHVVSDISRDESQVRGVWPSSAAAGTAGSMSIPVTVPTELFIH